MNDLLDDLNSTTLNSFNGSIITNVPMESGSVVTVAANQANYNSINTLTEQINENCEEIDQLADMLGESTRTEQKEIEGEIQEIVSSTNGLIRSNRSMLDRAQMDFNSANPTNQPTKNKINENAYNSAVNAFGSAITRFLNTMDQYQSASKQDFVRQAHIINPEMSEQQTQELMDSNDPAQYLQTHVMQISPDLLDAVDDLTDQRDKIQGLEQTINDIQELMNTTAMLVAEGGQKLDEAEYTMEAVEMKVENANVKIEKAEEYVVETRKTKTKTYIVMGCCMLLLLLVVLFILGWTVGPLKALLGK